MGVGVVGGRADLGGAARDPRRLRVLHRRRRDLHPGRAPRIAPSRGRRREGHPLQQRALRAGEGPRERLGTTWGLSETGASGPTGNRYGDSAGHACIAVSGPVERVLTIETRQSDREANMWIFARAAVELLEACVKEHGAKA